MTPLLLALCMHSASAFTASDLTDNAGIEPHRVQHRHPQVQARLRHTEAWQRLREATGDTWQVDFDEVTGTPRHMWGGGVPLGVPNEEALVAKALHDTLLPHHELLGFDPGALHLVSANYVERLDTWYVDFDVLRDGLRTYRGGISARVKQGNLIMLHVATAPHAPVTGEERLSQAQAVQAAIQQGPVPGAQHTEPTVEAILLEQDTPLGLELRRTWMVKTRTQDPPGLWVSFVDAQTGELLNVHNEVRFAQGSVQGKHNRRTLDGSPLITSAMPYAEVGTNSDGDTTDAQGLFNLNGSGYATVLSGTYTDVNNASGNNGYLASNSPDMTWTTSIASQAEISTYKFIHDVKWWGESTAPEVGMVNVHLKAWVNIGDVCNAYWDGNVNFFQAGYGCNNTGQIADVVYHEWGHGFHYYSLQAGYFDGSLSEGASDVVAFFQTGDHVVAPYFMTNGSGIRDVAPNKAYPEDYTNNDYYVHENGLIFGGAMWDLWDTLSRQEGPTIGTQSTEDIFTGLLKGGTDIPGTYYEALVADDDDGDLNNGTPHECAINQSFGLHGLGPGGGAGSFMAYHEPLTNVSAQQPISVELEVIAPNEDCEPVDARGAVLRYRVNGGEWKNRPTELGRDTITAEIPEQDEGSFVEYYVEGNDTQDRPFAVPRAGEIAPYSLYVGEVIEIHCDDFEANDGGYTHTLLYGQEVDGADDWEWGAPAGLSGDPSSSFSGQRSWGNDLGKNNNNGSYMANSHSQLDANEVSTGHYTDVFLQYRRWLTVEDATFDKAVIQANGERVWMNWESSEGNEHTIDSQWISHTVDLQGIVDQGTAQISWILRPDEGLEFGGWTIDDVCLFAPATADNRLGITDFQAEMFESGQVGLSWTNPAHRPVKRVIVVRNTSDWPEDHTDGQLIYNNEDPEPGEQALASDLNPSLDRAYYAVYAYDGAEWLSWTIEGWNADRPSASQVDDALAASEARSSERGGCGCASGGTAPWASLWGLPLLLGFRRRS